MRKIIEDLIALKDMNKRRLTLCEIETINDACNCIDHLAERAEAKQPEKACVTEYYPDVCGSYEAHCRIDPACSNCGASLLTNKYDRYPEYCPQCGQHIDWSDWFNQDCLA